MNKKFRCRILWVAAAHCKHSGCAHEARYPHPSAEHSTMSTLNAPSKHLLEEDHLLRNLGVRSGSPTEIPSILDTCHHTLQIAHDSNHIGLKTATCCANASALEQASMVAAMRHPRTIRTGLGVLVPSRHVVQACPDAQTWAVNVTIATAA